MAVPSGNSSADFITVAPNNMPDQQRLGSEATSPTPIIGHKHQLPVEEDDNNWDDIRSYMHIKQRKLREQFQTIDDKKQSAIFDGVTIYVNGWTQPNTDELKALMYAHGGKYEFNVYSNSSGVTHTIATNLPNSKIKNLGNTIVCKPSWIVDSVAAGRKQPVDDYLLYKPTGKGGQKKLGFAIKTEVPRSSVDPSKFDSSSFDVVHSKGDSVSKGSQLPLAKVGVSIANSNPPTSRFLDYGDENMKPAALAAAVRNYNSDSICPPLHDVESNDNPDSSRVCSTSDDIHVPLSVPAPGARVSNGAKFVSDFFTHSRLHYLSTWSTELKQFTAKMLKEIKPKLSRLTAERSLRRVKQRAVIHIDLDCFFVSVSIRDKPQLKGVPVAVTHAKLPSEERSQNTNLNNQTLSIPALESKDVSSDPSSIAGDKILSIPVNMPGQPSSSSLLNSTSDVASCSYEARKAGVSNGMSVGAAMKRCPNLVLLPYDFESYRSVSQTLYEILLLYSSVVEAVSCDEAYVELTDYASSFEHVESIVKELREEIQAKTGCTVSAGISHNMLLARMSTRVAKPDGQFRLSLDGVDDFLNSQKARDLPGVGYSTAMKLKEMGIEDCNNLRRLSLSKLQGQFGSKTGKTLHDYSRGIDDRELKLSTERKSISVDINFGIRFSEITEAESLISNIAVELEKRAKDAEVVGGTVILKMKIRKPDAPKETWKYLGHGACNNVTRSHTLLYPTRTASEVSRLAMKLLLQVKPEASDIRGMGLQLGKLVSTAESQTKSGQHASSLGANIREMFKPRTTMPGTSRSDENLVAADPPLSNVYTETDHNPASNISMPQYALRSGASPGIVPLKSSAAALPTSTSVTDESFAIDLPPASQLDNSVLAALPAALRDKILRGYENTSKGNKTILSSLETTQRYPELKVAEVTSLGTPFESTMTTVPSQNPFPVDNMCKVTQQLIEDTVPSEYHLSIISDSISNPIIENEEEFLVRVREYIKDWVTSFIEGPLESDVEQITQFLCALLQVNLEMTLLALKCLRRILSRLELSSWFPTFNSLLYTIQSHVKLLYGGSLSLESL